MNNVTITGTSSPVTLGFDPEFLPQFSGIYSCTNEGQTFQEAVMITTGIWLIILILHVCIVSACMYVCVVGYQRELV